MKKEPENPVKLPHPIDETSEFDRFYVVIVPKSGSPQVSAARYKIFGEM